MPHALPQTFNAAYDKAGDEGTAAGSGDGPRLERVEPGAYLFACCGYENRKAGDKDVLRLFCRVESGINGQATGQETKLTAYDMFMTEKAMWKLAGSMKCLNISCSDRQMFHAEAFVGRYFAGAVQERTYNKQDGSTGVITSIDSIAPPLNAELNADPRDASDPGCVEAAQAFIDDTDLPF